jgi:hypothetical protein
MYCSELYLLVPAASDTMKKMSVRAGLFLNGKHMAAFLADYLPETHHVHHIMHGSSPFLLSFG